MAVLNEEQEMLRDMAREWTVNESPVTEFRKVRASGEPEAFNRDAYATMAQMGWAGVIIPEEHGGSDFGFLSAGLVVEELAEMVVPVQPAAHHGAGHRHVEEREDACSVGGQQRVLLEELLQRPVGVVLAHRRPAATGGHGHVVGGAMTPTLGQLAQQAIALAEVPLVAAVARCVQQGQHEGRVGVRRDHPHRAGLGQRLHVVWKVHAHLAGVLHQLAQGGDVPHPVDDDVAVLEQWANQHPLLHHARVADDRGRQRAEVQLRQALVGAQRHERHQERRVGAELRFVHRRQLVAGVQHQLLQWQEPGGHQRGATVHHVIATAGAAVTLRR